MFRKSLSQQNFKQSRAKMMNMNLRIQEIVYESIHPIHHDTDQDNTIEQHNSIRVSGFTVPRARKGAISDTLFYFYIPYLDIYCNFVIATFIQFYEQ